MLVQLNEWGNSLGIRIPKKYRDVLRLSKGSNVELLLKDNSIVVSPVKESSLFERMADDVDLDEMVNRITTENRHVDSWRDDIPAGHEVW